MSANQCVNTPENSQVSDKDHILKQRMAAVKNKIVVLSGKGGVGKSTVAINLATALAMQDKKVGLLDVDIHGPSIPTMLGLEEVSLRTTGEEIYPERINGLENLCVISIGFLLKQKDDPVIWRGPMKITIIKQFLSDVIWDELDYLVVDCPPGTGDEPLSVLQMLGENTGAVIVTTPQQVAIADVHKSVNFCNRLGTPILGIVENMNGFICPECNKETFIFNSNGGKELAEKCSVPFLGSIPIDPLVGNACDSGTPYLMKNPDSLAAERLRTIVNTTISNISQKGESIPGNQKEKTMKIAIPVADGKLNTHFGHCAAFALMDVDMETKKIVHRVDVDAPPHEPGLLPKWLGEKNVNMIITGGMGQRAQSLFQDRDIKVCVGAPCSTPEELVTDFMNGTLQTGVNACDH